MKDRLLCRCADDFEAHRVESTLDNSGVFFRRVDERDTVHSGMAGPTPGIEFYVAEEDYDQAKRLVDVVSKIMSHYDSKGHRGTSGRDWRSVGLILGIFLFLIPLVYLAFTSGTKYESDVMYYICIAVFISSFVVTWFCGRKKK